MQNSTGKRVLFEGEQPQTILASVAISSYISVCSLVYTLRKRHRGGGFFKENVVCHLTALCSLTCSAYNLAVYRFGDAIMTSQSTCTLSSVVYGTVVTASRCFGNLVFACRYKTINQNNRAVAVKRRAHQFTVSITVVSLLHLVFTYFYTAFAPRMTNCEQGRVEGGEGFLFLGVGILCYTLITLIQTVILVEIVKPVARHCMHLNATTISNKLLWFFINFITFNKNAKK